MINALQSLIPTLLLDVVHIAIIFVIGKLLIRLVTAAVVASISIAKRTSGFSARVRTITRVIHFRGNAILYGVVVFLILEVLGIDIGPLLAGVGALGLIAGIASQTVIKDFVSSILISAEDQYRVGEHVKINSTIEGTVMQIAMRLTTLRGTDGEIHNILNSSITAVTNYSRNKK